LRSPPTCSGRLVVGAAMFRCDELYSLKQADWTYLPPAVRVSEAPLVPAPTDDLEFPVRSCARSKELAGRTLVAGLDETRLAVEDDACA
jgi:hypothetical protein